MASSDATDVAVEAVTDLPAGAHLVLVGSCAALGDWNPDAALVLEAVPRGAPSRCSFAATASLSGETATEHTRDPDRGSVAAPAAAPPRAIAPQTPPVTLVTLVADLPESFECKLAWRQASGEWLWQEGPNRAVSVAALPVRGDSGRVFISWLPFALSEERAAAMAPPASDSATAAADTAGDSAPSAALEAPWLGVIDGPSMGDPWLAPQRAAVAERARQVRGLMTEMDEASDAEGLGTFGLDGQSRGHEFFGLTRGSDASGREGWWFRDWAPGAVGASLVGDLNGWDTTRHVCERDGMGVWSVFVADAADGSPGIAHGSAYKVSLLLPADAPAGGGDAIGHEEAGRLGLGCDGASLRRVWRLPPWARACRMDGTSTHLEALHWAPAEGEEYRWRHGRVRWADAVCWPGEHHTPGLGRVGPAAAGEAAPPAAAAAAAAPFKPEPAALPSGGGGGHASRGLRIYECHAGLAGDEPRVHTYAELAADVLPRVAALGYNAVQLMGVVEHAYYASFGYLVNAFSAPAGRSGTPEDFKAAVDAAHGLGLAVIIDLVHSHASSNVLDGLNGYDGTDHCYFHEGARGRHSAWGSRLFHYGHPEVRRFLLSNVRMWLEDYRVDGFRFDGVTSMLYRHHGIGHGFSGDYGEYFGPDTDEEAVSYLALANALCHCADPPALTIAEDVSGMPTLCRPVADGGVGFDYRLHMAVPDEWIKAVKEVADEAWDVERLVHVLVNRRWQEKCVVYAESHDQALVGDKTLAFRLMDAAMYDSMSALSPAPPVVDRGVALHKLIRLFTHALGGEGWLCFMGNEFGHPEWLDFPREGNGWSYHYARRQYSLADDPTLRYRFLAAFDGALQGLEEKGPCPWLVPGIVSRRPAA